MRGDSITVSRIVPSEQRVLSLSNVCVTLLTNQNKNWQLIDVIPLIFLNLSTVASHGWQFAVSPLRLYFRKAPFDS